MNIKKKIFVFFNKIIFICMFLINISYCNDFFNIKKIEIYGNKNVENNVILKKINKYIVNNQISEKNINNFIKNKKNLYYFNNIKITVKNKILKLYVKENPLIKKINIYNNKLLNKKKIIDILNKFKITENNFLNKNLFINFKNKIIKIYNNNGKYNLNNKYNIKYDKKNNITIDIFLNEGNFCKINNIKIIGNKIINKKNILKILKIKDNILKFTNSIYKKNKFIKNIYKLKNFYNNNGYINFKINIIKIDFNSKKEKINIFIDINEGKKYNINRIFIKSNNIKKKYINYIKNKLIKYKNSIYSNEIINKIKFKILNYLFYKGYNINKINIKIIKKNNLNNKLNIFYEIINKNRYLNNNLNIFGNIITNKKLIENEINYKKNKGFNLKKIYNYLDILNSTNYFKNIEIKVKKNKINKNFLNDLNIYLEENKFLKYNFGLNFKKNSLNLKTNIENINLFGNGKHISIVLDYNIKNFEICLNLNNPYYLTDKTYKIGLNIKNNIIFDDDYSFKPIIKYYTISNFINFKNKNINNNYELFLLKNNITEDFNNNKNIYIYKNYLYKKKYIEKNFIIFLINNLKINTLDNETFSNKGYKIEINLKNSLPISDNKFNEINIKSRKFFPLIKNKKIIFNNNIIFNILNDFSYSNILYYKSMFNNFNNFSRGYYDILNNSYIPQYNIFFKNNYNKLISNNLQLLLNNEIIFNKLINKLENIFNFALFIDTNLNLFYINKKIDFKYYKNFSNKNNLNLSTGISLNFKTPLGLLKISYAFPIYNNNIKYKINNLQFNLSDIN